MTFFFHGTNTAALASIRRFGLQLRQYEASLTMDLRIAACLYTCRANDANLAIEKEKFVVQRSDACLSPTVGGVFILRPSTSYATKSPTAQIWVCGLGREIWGGINKWIGNYQTLYRSSRDAVLADDFSELFQGGDLYASPRWQRDRRDRVVVPAMDILAWIPATPELLAWAQDCKPFYRRAHLQKAAPSALVHSLGEVNVKIIRLQSRASGLCRLLRRMTLSAFWFNGVRIVKADCPNPCDQDPSVLLDRSVYLTALSQLKDLDRSGGQLAVLVDALEGAFYGSLRFASEIEWVIDLVETFTSDLAVSSKFIDSENGAA